MSQTVSLPIQGRPFEIRFESIGGLGAQAAARALATAAVMKMGLNATHGTTPGPERKGSLARTFVRLAPADRPIRASAPVRAPDAIVVFHAPLLRESATLAGLRKDGTLIYAGPPKPIPEELSALPRTARAIRLDASGIATKENCGPDAALLGAVCAAFPFLAAREILEAFREGLAGANAELIAANERAFGRGAAEMVVLAEVGEADGDLPPVHGSPAWGYRTQPIGGVLARPGNSAWNDLSSARAGFLPVLNREQCIHCAMCDMVCPDHCLAWEKGEEGGRFQRELTGVDYRYCKGCMRCVETCPASAMLRKAETPGLAERKGVELFELAE